MSKGPGTPPPIDGLPTFLTLTRFAPSWRVCESATMSEEGRVVRPGAPPHIPVRER